MIGPFSGGSQTWGGKEQQKEGKKDAGSVRRGTVLVQERTRRKAYGIQARGQHKG